MTLSLGLGIPSGLIVPFGFGMYTRSAGLNWNDLSFSVLMVASAHSKDMESSVSLSTPGVMFPGFDFMFQYAVFSMRMSHSCLYVGTISNSDVGLASPLRQFDVPELW